MNFVYTRTRDQQNSNIVFFKMYVKLFAILFIIIGASQTYANITDGQECCLGKNIYTKKCQEGQNLDAIVCENGRFMLDPTINDFDKYTITDDGTLEMESDYSTPRSK